MMHLSNEELEQRYSELEHILPLNEFIFTPVQNHYDPISQSSEIMAQHMKNQEDLIQQLKLQVEDLTRIVNVIAPLSIKYNRRKLNTNGRN